MNSSVNFYDSNRCVRIGDVDKILIMLWQLWIFSTLIAPIKHFICYLFFRIQKCNSCYNYLSEVRIIVEKKQSASGKLGNLLKEVQILMAQID